MSTQLATLGADQVDLIKRRFAECVSLERNCHRWNGAIKSNGYGVIRIAGKTYHAHRVSVFLSGRTLDERLVVDHLCRNKWCVNPCHLELVTKSQNAIRGIPGQKKSHCKNGHALVEPNLYVYGGRRFCKACAIQRSKSRSKGE